jgi:hypothetical protein
MTLPNHLDSSARRSRALCALCAVATLLAGASAAIAQPATTRPPIYSCSDANGKKLTSDRPIPECSTRDQRVLNADGSVRGIVAPTPTADERSEMDARQRIEVTERAARQDAIRRDRNLLVRFPDEATHRKAREAALNDVNKALKLSADRLAALAAERKPLMDEAEFYVGKPLPAKLKMQLDANDALVEAQRALVLNQRLEIGRIDRLYDAELARLRKLWNGVQPGSLGVIVTDAAASAAKP